MDSNGSGLSIMENILNKDNLYERMKTLQNGEELIVFINEDVIKAMEWIRFKENNLNNTLIALQENRYGFYDKDHVLKVYSDLEDLRLEKQDILFTVGEALLGENWRQLLNETECEFRVDEALPVVVIFKLCKN